MFGSIIQRWYRLKLNVRWRLVEKDINPEHILENRGFPRVTSYRSQKPGSSIRDTSISFCQELLHYVENLMSSIKCFQQDFE